MTASPAAAPEIQLGVVVLTYGTPGRYEPLLRTLLAAKVDPASVVLVQNPATSDEPRLEPSDDRVAVLRLERNAGYPGGMNAGIRQQSARGVTHVLLLTHDVRLRPGALGALLAASAAHPSAGVLGPALWDAETQIPFSFGVRRTRWGGLIHVETLPSASAGGSEVMACDSIDGAAMLIRSDVLTQVGLFADRFFMYFEEADLCLRATRAGWQVGVVAGAQAEQQVGVSRRPGTWGYLMTRNGLAYARSAVGPLGLIGGLGRFCREVVRHALLGLRPSTSRAARPVHWLILRGTTRGVLDYFLGRWGPPPRSLAGLGDVTGTD